MPGQNPREGTGFGTGIDLALVYGVTTKRLNEQVRRNAERLPADFFIRPTNQDVAAAPPGRSADRRDPTQSLFQHVVI